MKLFKSRKIMSFEILTIRESGMRSTIEYEILNTPPTAEVSMYFIKYGQGKRERNLHKRANVPAKSMIGLLNDCGVLKWDGFSGDNPPGMLDGTMFSLKATVNGDRKIRADGSNNYPRHYRDFTDKIRDILYSADETEKS